MITPVLPRVVVAGPPKWGTDSCASGVALESGRSDDDQPLAVGAGMDARAGCR